MHGVRLAAPGSDSLWATAWGAGALGAEAWGTVETRRWLEQMVIGMEDVFSYLDPVPIYDLT